MTLWQALLTALLDLGLHKFRSALAVLGIVFGVAAVVGMVSIGEGAREEAMRNIAAMGIRTVLVRSVKPTDEDGGDQAQGSRYVADYGLKRRDLAHVRKTFPGVEDAVGIRDMRSNLYTRSGAKLDLDVLATEPAFLRISNSTIRRGRFLTWLDARDQRGVCVVGTTAARKLFGYRDPLDNMVKIGGDWYRVVGLLDNHAGIRVSDREDVTAAVFIPLATAQARFGDVTTRIESGVRERVRVELDAIYILMEQTDDVLAAADRVRRWLQKTHEREDYALSIPLALLRQKAAHQRIFGIVMGSIAGISLLVGGIGIMNIMLANVTERRREIGTRRALGALRRDILLQFVFEAGTLTSLGGLAGALVGYGLSWGVSTYAGWPTSVTPISVVLAIGLSCAVGVVFGLWPAWQAAKTNPIEALRSE